MAINIERLKMLRGERGLSQVGLSRTAGVPSATLAAIEAGVSKNPRYDTVIKIAVALQVDPGVLFLPGSLDVLSDTPPHPPTAA